MMEQARISTPQGTQPAQGLRQRPAAEGADANAPQGGFLALLAALDSAAISDTGPAGAQASALEDLSAAASDNPSVLTDVSALAAWQGLWAGGQRALEGAAVAGAAGGAGGVSAWAGALRGNDGSALGLVAETAQLDGAADQLGAALPGGLAAPARGGLRTQATALSGQRNGASLVPGAADVGALRATSAPVVAQQALVGAQALPGAWAAVESAALFANQRLSALDSGQMTGGDAGARESLAETFASDFAASALGSTRSPDGAGAGRHGDGQPDGSLASGGAAHEASEASSVDGTPAFAEHGPFAAEDRVAEQVAYWVNQKTQNAELTVNRDGQPMEVSVTLNGNEAHISFRSDQQDARDLLDRSAAQLRELLGAEGLVLSGMTVGVSTRDGGNGSNSMAQPRHRETVRHAQVAGAADTGSGTAVRRDRVTDRSVDVFV